MSVCASHYKGVMIQAIQSKRVRTCLILLASFGIITFLFSYLLPAYRGFIYLFWLSIISNTVIPLTPHEPILLLYGQLYSPLLVAICATIAVSLIEYINYQILVPILDLKRAKSFREKRYFQRAEHYFNKLPFTSLIVSCITPVPFFPFRILAVTTGYSIKRYVFSIFVGRIPRYYVLALTGKMLNLPTWVYIAVIIAFLATLLIKKLNEKLK